MESAHIQALANDHGLLLKDEFEFNEMGIDFRVVFATATNGSKWVLRIPRRNTLVEQIEKERRIIELVRKYISVAVPDWQIVSPTLIAYPLLEDKPVITLHPQTYEAKWNIDKRNPQFVPSLAKLLVDLHQIPLKKAVTASLKVQTPEMVREEVLDKIKLVKQELGIPPSMETRWKKWVDNDRLWAEFTSFIHGDLYAGHILASESGSVSGIIDWSEAQVGDSSIDFTGHLAVFGGESLQELIIEYEKKGGRTWENMYEQIVERHAAASLQYAYFAITTQDEVHINGAKTQLGLGE